MAILTSLTRVVSYLLGRAMTFSYAFPFVIPDSLIIRDPLSICALQHECMALPVPQLDLFLAERIEAFSQQPAGRLIRTDIIRSLQRADQLPFALAGSVCDDEWHVYVQAQGAPRSFLRLHPSVTSGEHTDVDLVASLRRGFLFACHDCPTGLVSSRQPLYVRRSQITPLGRALIAAPARVMAVTRQFVDDNLDARPTRPYFTAHLHSILPLARLADIDAAWRSDLVPEHWRRAGTKRHQASP